MAEVDSEGVESMSDRAGRGEGKVSGRGRVREREREKGIGWHTDSSEWKGC